MVIKQFFAALKEEKKYLIFACLLFIFSCLVGAIFFTQVNELVKEAGLFDQLEKVVKKIEQTPTFATSFSTIFFNNLSASLVAIGAGVFLGIFPMMLLISNGLLLSVAVIESATQANIHPMILFVTTVLPHGIFELPAIMIGAALGIRLGMAMLRLVIALFVPQRREQSMIEWRGLKSRVLMITAGMVVFLFVAAIIESGLIILMYSFA